MRINKVLVKPVVTEKAVDMYNREGKYTFEVDLFSTQSQIKKALKDVYDVEAIELRSNVLPGKRKRVPKTARFTTTQMRKKVIFKLRKGKLDIYQGE
ncbi:MAG TPA: 50S ribosomal protein L23 [candidate division WWE3 bacterium]|uniref:Large ribosomal subunit protein uL23 n=1 Tax=candidate division WWE3 bacterium TaxID=2053526 RepID=A0A7C1HHC4_UNCKA|nr:50S ribosomal protein L23 [candidate division WWE3 bacterium]